MGNEIQRFYCADCGEQGVETLMIEDNGAGHLCPIHDKHPRGQCGNDFPCSGWDGRPCVMNEKDILDSEGGPVVTTWDALP